MLTLPAAGIGVVLSVVSVCVYLLYRWLLPKPIPGIPYNPEAAKRLFGDAPDMLREVSVTGEFGVWCATQVKKMDSPVSQVFIRPFAKPWVLLADFRESRDILMRRREFDKSKFISDGMACLGEFHGLYRTGPEFKSNRQLVQDLMTSTFLNGHAGHAIHAHGLQLIKLLELKSSLAHGRPFSVSHDIEYTAVDTMLTFAFADNWDKTTLGPQVEAIEELEVSDLQGGGIDDPVGFPHVQVGEFLHAIYEAPKVEKGLENLRNGHVVSAVEHMLMRETTRAEKQGREPRYDGSVFVDEIFAHIVAGHHTTSVTPGVIFFLFEPFARGKYFLLRTQCVSREHRCGQSSISPATQMFNRSFDTLYEVTEAKAIPKNNRPTGPAFTHIIGEVELFQEFATKNMGKAAHKAQRKKIAALRMGKLKEFMRANSKLFATTPTLIGKLTAYEMWKSSRA
ncbi:hypothetical protein F4824DRAFT_501637 [Ustulina deusta]|nr:hypothetical protein F4824DRAFT_501637 [Ustulina deusta]